MSFSRLFFRERSLSKVVAVFPQAVAAQRASEEVKSAVGLEDRQVQVVGPRDARWDRKVEPESIGIWRTAVRSHLTCGIAGLILGVTLWLALYAMDVAIIVATPGLSFFAVTLFATMLGLMFGGALTLRPDHDIAIDSVQEARANGRWAIVVHPVSREQFDAALRLLQATGAQVAHTL